MPGDLGRMHPEILAACRNILTGKELTTMVHNVVFDIGGVMAQWRPELWFRKRFGEELGARVLAAAVGNKEWGELVDRGVMSEADFFSRQRQRYPRLAAELTAAEKEWWEILRPIEDTVELIRRLKAAEYRVYYLSNYPEKSFQYLCGIMPVFGEMDGGVVSWEVHRIKPEPEIYRLLLERYGLREEETVFTDDTQANIDAAKALGISAWRFADAAGFEEYLKRQLGMTF